MSQITVLTPFLLNLGGTIRKFEAGVVEVDEEVASHWYVKLFSEQVAEPEPQAPAPSDEAQGAPEPDRGAHPEESSVAVEDDGSTHVDTPEDVDEKTALKAEAEGLGIEVDGRWGVARLMAEIEAKKNAA
ncbi:hypothetical protein OSH11_11710 [Kaistia dalseonensis]|uniref:Uncharacterized protein n=1 Tax=Kaistia dalseonensis TaxID=410840 RepID=A0ABU0H6M1_9HYPH|nr:hypothetical protein [Kaistia dalseonensis]MCX5495376.1 hypothetical protein [Kaistia dalseonensis]MDQ0437963.1 hypothetical protein [Kaistia dalseonensis]